MEIFLENAFWVQNHGFLRNDGEHGTFTIENLSQPQNSKAESIPAVAARLVHSIGSIMYRALENSFPLYAFSSLPLNDIKLYFSANRLGNIAVQVCDGANGCTACGKFQANAGGAWGSLDCNGHGAIGTTVKLANPADHLQFCEMEMFGTGNFSISPVFNGKWNN